MSYIRIGGSVFSSLHQMFKRGGILGAASDAKDMSANETESPLTGQSPPATVPPGTSESPIHPSIPVSETNTR